MSRVKAMERRVPHSRAELAKHQLHGDHVLLLFHHGDATLNELVNIKVIVQEPILSPMADDEILGPGGKYLGGVIPPWPGPTTLRASVMNVISATVTTNVTRTAITRNTKVTVNVAVSS
jgi:hypothetical protein